jgi:glycogenin glucosyltransferase
LQATTPAAREAMAYVTVLSTDSYLSGVLVLNESLRLSKARYPLNVVVGEEVSPSVREALARAGIPQIDSPPIDIPLGIRQANLHSDYHPHWAWVFEKLVVFSLCQFRKLVLLDSDILVVRNLDRLFCHPHMSAVIADPADEKCVDLNSGVMVIEPEPQLTNQLTAIVPETFESEREWRVAAGRPPSMGDQSIINEFWSSWLGQEQLHLHPKYNVATEHLDHYVRRMGYRWRGPDGIHVLHFVGQVKPWMTTRRHLVRTVCQLVARRRIWELAALVSYMAMLGRVRWRLRRMA